MYRMYSPHVYGIDLVDSILNAGPSLLMNSKFRIITLRVSIGSDFIE